MTNFFFQALLPYTNQIVSLQVWRPSPATVHFLNGNPFQAIRYIKLIGLGEKGIGLAATPTFPILQLHGSALLRLQSLASSHIEIRFGVDSPHRLQCLEVSFPMDVDVFLDILPLTPNMHYVDVRLKWRTPLCTTRTVPIHLPHLKTLRVDSLYRILHHVLSFIIPRSKFERLFISNQTPTEREETLIPLAWILRTTSSFSIRVAPSTFSIYSAVLKIKLYTIPPEVAAFWIHVIELAFDVPSPDRHDPLPTKAERGWMGGALYLVWKGRMAVMDRPVRVFSGKTEVEFPRDAENY